MISKTAIKIFGVRTNVMRVLGNTFPYKWNWGTGKLERNGVYGRWNFNVFLFYLNCYIFLLILKFLRRATGTVGETNGGSVGSSIQITSAPPSDELIDEGVEKSTSNHSANQHHPILLAVDMLFMALIWCVGCISTVLVQYSEDWALLTNTLISTDLKLQEKFSTALSFHPFAKRASKLLEYLMLFIAFTTTFLVPFVFGSFFLQNTNPLHRFLARVFEIHVSLKLRFLPLILFSIWAFLIAASIAAFGLLAILLYLASTLFWLSSLKPVGICPEKTTGGRKYRTLLGDTDCKTILGMYRSFQILNRLLSRCLGYARVATHQSTIQIATIVCSFISVRYYDMVIYNVGHSFFLLAPFICFLVIYVETRIVTTTIDSSKRLLKELDKLLRGDRTFQGKLLKKQVKASWRIRVDAAYPYYEINKRTFWEFVDVTLNFLVDALMTY